MIAELALLTGAFALLVVIAARLAPWVGDRRYLAVAIGLPLAIGLGALVLGAAELAWIWLVPAAVLAAAPRLGRFGVVAVAAAVLPGALVVAPDPLREALWHRFWPQQVPLAVWIAGFAISPLAALGWWLRTSRPASRLGALALPVGAGLAVVLGAAALFLSSPPCTAEQFSELSLACESVRNMR